MFNFVLDKSCPLLPAIIGKNLRSKKIKFFIFFCKPKIKIKIMTDSTSVYT